MHQREGQEVVVVVGPAVNGAVPPPEPKNIAEAVLAKDADRTVLDRLLERGREAAGKLPRIRLKPISWKLVVAYLRYYAWQICTQFVLGAIYLVVIAEGLRCLIPALAQKLYKLPIPGFFMFEEYEWSYRLDLAMFFSLFLLIAIWHLWARALLLWLNDDAEFDFGRWNAENHRTLMVWLGGIILACDTCLFYAGVAQMGWSGGGLSFAGLIATCAYVAVIVFVKYRAIDLHREILELERKDQ